MKPHNLNTLTLTQLALKILVSPVRFLVAPPKESVENQTIKLAFSTSFFR